MITSSPWLSIVLDCQKCYLYNPNYPNMPGAIHNASVEGTTTEGCWNIVIIQSNSKKIQIIRFGAG